MKAKHIKDIIVIDPDSGGEVEVSIFKHPGGGLFGLDTSYIEQVLDDETVDELQIPDPFDQSMKNIQITLDI